MAPKPAIDRRLQRLASAFTPEWLAAQRWYRGKSRRLASVALVDATPIEGGPGWLFVLGATDSAGGGARYLVPVTSDDGSFREPRDGEGVWRGLAALILEGGELDGVRGRWLFTPTEAVTRLLPGGVATLPALAERRLGVQQSNSSVAIGDQLMLKVYRLLERGANPEVEVNAFLTSAGLREAPALAGSASYLLDGELHSAAILQQFVPSEGDGWSWVLGRLAAAPDGPAEATAGIAQLGTLTKALHAALGSHPEVPGFPSRTATSSELATWHSRAEGQLESALGTLVGDPHQRLLAIAPRIRERLAAIGAARGARAARIHGDYHLGQLLRTPTGFKVIDFEGEPARPLAERREPASPLRDVAGMLRSIDYVAQVALREGGLDEPDAWADDAREVFLSAYGGISSRDEPLLDAFEIEKACYEVRYEANNRPDWVWVPLGALERLAARQGN